MHFKELFKNKQIRENYFFLSVTEGFFLLSKELELTDEFIESLEQQRHGDENE